MLKKQISEPIKQFVKKVLSPIPPHISKNFIRIDKEGLILIEKSIRENYHTGWRNESNYSKEKYQEDLNTHLIGRLENDRRIIVPWIDNATNLKNKRILEIGCGTGSSTIALAEQGADVTGIDIDEGALLVAKKRSKIYNLKAEYKLLNAEDLSRNFINIKFDIVIFFACLEHMKIEERLTSLREAWKMLSTDGLLIIVETPNRLWYFDNHTSMLPFFHWLPNELAFQYSKFSPRDNFRELYKEYDETSKEHFLRRGRGMSFHELELAIGRAKDLNIVSSLSTFAAIRYNLKKTRLDKKYKSILMNIYPNIHEGFFDDFLYLIIKKNK